MILVDGDVPSDVVDSYITWIACMLRKIELMSLSSMHLCRLYRDMLLAVLDLSSKIKKVKRKKEMQISTAA